MENDFSQYYLVLYHKIIHFVKINYFAYKVGYLSNGMDVYLDKLSLAIISRMQSGE